MKNDAIEHLSAAAARLSGTVHNAGDVVMAIWPLTCFIAANPARVLERLPFDQAVEEAEMRLGGKGLMPATVYHRFAEQGLISQAAVRDAFQARRAQATPLLAIAGESVSAATIQWLGHFESAFADPAASEDPLTAAAQSAAVRADAAAPSAGAVPDDDAGARQVDAYMIRWCAAYTDTGQAAWSMPRRGQGLWHAWRRLAVIDPTLDRVAGRRLRSLLAEVPDRSEEAAVVILDRLGVAEADWQSVFEAQLLRLPGWASYLKGRADQAGPGTPDTGLLTDYLAVRLAYTHALAAPPMATAGRRPTDPSPEADAHRTKVLVAALAGLARRLSLSAAALRDLPADELAAVVTALDALSPAEQSLIWLAGHEETYRSGLLNDIGGRLGCALGDEPTERPHAQAAFCIDVRSEPFRRNLEAAGRVETLGFAGFYGVPVEYTAFGEETSLDVCPALIKPGYRIADGPAPSCRGHGERHRRGRDLVRQTKKVTSGLKGSAAACFGFVEAVGGLFAAPFFGRTFAPRRYAAAGDWLDRSVAPPIEVAPDLVARREDEQDTKHGGRPYGLSMDERIFFAEAALSIMGLTRNFARLVLLNGHGSMTENNPYKSALDCGACGGNTGGPSARILAAILNEPAVRGALEKRGIFIPVDTLFLAGEHNTTTDEVAIYNADTVPASHRADLSRLRATLATARERTCAERRARLTVAGSPTVSALAHTEERATDWAQVRPEWGLARNAAFLIGPRSMTQGLDLEGRTFLHSYDWRGDPKGSALEIILTAPMVVAEWINTQYYFSTADNLRFGAGSKVTHNVVGQIGTMQGNASDLQIGLPEQSVMTAHGVPYHEPIRLMTVCLAPPDRVAEIIARNSVLQQLFDHDWVAMVVIEPSTGRFLRYAHGAWVDVLPGDLNADPEDAETVKTEAELEEVGR